ncbi:DUF1707 domain-containing protein [Streptomyces sp. GC420]|nr:DUF1707 domain-containing protein [Streptomyces sp. GC420]
MRASDADRERAVDVLRAAYGEGRLSKSEHDHRVGAVYRAATYGELVRLVGDLPHGPLPFAPGPAAVPQAFLPPPPRPTNGSASGALVCGLLTMVTGGLTGVPAVILGHKARAEIRRTGEDGDGMAIAGLAMGWLAIGGWTLLILLFVLMSGG